MQPITHYFLGFDLGKDRDYSAIAACHATRARSQLLRYRRSA